VSDTQIAQTIVEQLGGTRFIAMTGATAFVGIKKGVQFKIKGKHPEKGKVSHIKIMLTDQDLYDVEYFRLYGGKIIEVAQSYGLYADMLKKDIEQNTQLHLSL